MFPARALRYLNGVHLKRSQFPLPLERQLGRGQLLGEVPDVLVGPQTLDLLLQVLDSVVVGPGGVASPRLLDGRGRVRLGTLRRLVVEVA